MGALWAASDSAPRRCAVHTCAGTEACLGLDTSQCASALPASPPLNCSGEGTCRAAALRIGACPAAAPCGVLCHGEDACRALRVFPPRSCVFDYYYYYYYYYHYYYYH